MKAIRTPSGATLNSLTDPVKSTGTWPLPGGSIVTEPLSATQRSSLPSQLTAVMPAALSRGLAANEATPPVTEPMSTASLAADTTARYFPSGDTAAMDRAGSELGGADGEAVESS